MKKSIIFAFFAALLITVVSLTGCSVVSSIAEVLKGTTTATGTDSGRVTSPEAVLSGTVSKSGDTVTINLNSVIVSGEAVDFPEATIGDRWKVFVGTTAGDYGSYLPVAADIYTSSADKIDMVFVLDNTGSMAGRIASVKDSISSFTASIEAAGWNVNFGVVAFGDNETEQDVLALPANSSQVATWLDELAGVGGGDIPENPLDSILYAYNNFTWRSDSRKVFVVIMDTSAHQNVAADTGYNNDCTTTLASVEALLGGNATVYSVSPKFSSGSAPDGYAGTADIRWLSDGYGWFSGVTTTTYGVTRPYSGTGGKWIELPASGDINLNELGISTAVTLGYNLRFTYSGSTLYVHVLVDTNGDGIWDSDGLFTIGISTSGTDKWLSTGELADPALGVKGSSNN
jgi:hypothetical protein